MTALRQKALLVIAGFGACHFIMASFWWLAYFRQAFRLHIAINDPLAAEQPLIALPCFALAVVFIIGVVQVVRHSKFVMLTIVLGVVSALFLFGYDISHERYQNRVHDGGRTKLVYLTWFWHPMAAPMKKDIWVWIASNIPEDFDDQIRMGANLDALNQKRNITPLMYAARNGWDAGIEKLLSNGAKIDATNRSGDTALIEAIRSGHYSTAGLLLAKGANGHLTNSSGESALSIAQSNQASVQSLFVKESAMK